MAKKSSKRQSAAVLLCAVLLLSAATVIAAKLIANVKLQINYDSDNVNVTGRASQTVLAETAAFGITLSTRNQTYSQAYQTLSANRERVLQLLRAAEIASTQIQFSPVTLKVNYLLNDQGNLTNQIFDRELQQIITVRALPDQASRCAQAVAGLLADGVELTCSPVEYSFADVEKYRQSLLQSALEDAKCQLTIIANAGQSRISQYKYIYPENLSVAPGSRPGEKILNLSVTAAANLDKK